jgi:hypothetical protein
MLNWYGRSFGMNPQMQLPGKNSPVCGALSLITPLISLLLALLGGRHVQRLQSSGEVDPGFIFMVVLLPLIGGLVLGMLLVGLAAWRDEKCRPLYWFGFLVNLLPLLCAFLKS